jgi:hypothetical protein
LPIWNWCSSMPARARGAAIPAASPGGYTDSLARAVDGHRHNEPPDTLVVTAAQVHPGYRGRGVAGELLMAHWRLGARIIGTAARSQIMTGSVAEWEGWTGMLFPASGDYVIPDGLAPLRIDRGADQGTYVEPGVWVQHQ